MKKEDPKFFKWHIINGSYLYYKVVDDKLYVLRYNGWGQSTFKSTSRFTPISTEEMFLEML